MAIGALLRVEPSHLAITGEATKAAWKIDKIN